MGDSLQSSKREWASFGSLEGFTTPPSATLVAFAQLHPNDRVLEVACGTGVVAVTAARAGAHVTGLDLTPELLEIARENASIAGVAVDFIEGDAEALPFADSTFDAVLSQFGHIFAPRPAVAVDELLRVLKPGGTVAFSTWPADRFVGRIFSLVARYLPPSPNAARPNDWGDPDVVIQRLGRRVTALTFERGVALAPALSPAHDRISTERGAGPVKNLVERLSGTPGLAAFRREYDALATEYFEANVIRHDFLMTRAIRS
jgi:SAM-dependent methyltransferase